MIAVTILLILFLAFVCWGIYQETIGFREYVRVRDQVTNLQRELAALRAEQARLEPLITLARREGFGTAASRTLRERIGSQA